MEENNKPLFDAEYDEADEPFPIEDDQKKIKKTVIVFEEEGVVISAYDIHTIEKDMRFVEHPQAHWEFGITINKGLTPGQFVTKTDISFWYMTEKKRDEHWNKMIKILESQGLSTIII